MRRLPLLPTIVVAAAVATMIGLGIWQLHRAEWKDRLLAEHAAAAALPALDLDPLLARDAPLPPLAFRRVLVTCRAREAEPVLRGGRSASPAASGGYSYFIPCRPGEAGMVGRLLVDAGWSPLPDDSRRISLDGLVAGRMGAVEPGRPLVLTSARAAPGLVPSAPTTIEQIPNNHRLYAAQWFFFAAAAALIYWLALRRRRG
jgi:cytochrome oxidase assembly protein ShyY1